MLSSKTEAGFSNDLFEPVLIANPYLKTIPMVLSFTASAENQQHVRDGCVWICVERIRKEKKKNSVSRERIEINLKSGRRIEEKIDYPGNYHESRPFCLFANTELIITSLQSGLILMRPQKKLTELVIVTMLKSSLVLWNFLTRFRRN